MLVWDVDGTVFFGDFDELYQSLGDVTPVGLLVILAFSLGKVSWIQRFCGKTTHAVCHMVSQGPTCR